MAWRQANPLRETAYSFGAGFLFDVLTLSRIDDTLTMLQHGAYLLVLGTLLILGEWWRDPERVPPRFRKAWDFYETAVHFVFGSLLSSFALFFFLSASGLTSLLFTFAMFGVLVANELPVFRSRGPVVRWALYALCVTCYFSYLLPIAFGFLSTWLVLLAVGCTLLVGWAFTGVMRRLGVVQEQWLRHVVVPGVAIQVLLVSMYFVHVLPPVPLNVQYMGVYHSLEKEAGTFRLGHMHGRWDIRRLWQHGDQDFRARPGDKVYVFASVFAPRAFRDRVNLRWLYDDPRGGWTTSDVIAMTVSGGREKGFRAYSNKANWRPGDWRVQVETEDGRAIGYIGFTVTLDPSTDERTFHHDVH